MAGRMEGGPVAGGVGLQWAVWGAAGVLLAAPWAAMRVTDAVAWDRHDFVMFGGLLLGGCVAWEAAVRMVRRPRWRIVAAAGIAAAVGLAWLNLGVGLFGPS